MPGLKSFSLASLPSAPTGRCPQVRRTWRYLKATHESVTGLLDSFSRIREVASQAKGSTKGRLSRDQVNLLRAALVFTSSGIDACCQQLIRDALPVLLHRGGTAEVRFREYLKSQLYEPKPPDGLLDAIAAADPRSQLIERYMGAMTKASFQGSSDLKERVRDVLGITNLRLPSRRFSALDGFFKARNDIAHQLDYANPSSPSVQRNHRAPANVVKQCDTAMALIADLVHATADLLCAG